MPKPRVETTHPMLPPLACSAGRTVQRSMKTPKAATTSRLPKTASARARPWLERKTVSMAQSIISEPWPKFIVFVVQKVRFRPRAMSA